MKPRARLNVALAFATMVAAVAYHTYRPDDPEPGSQSLVQIDPVQLTTIEIERVNNPRIVLQRTGTDWRMTIPVQARLDETALGRVLDLSRLKATNRLPATDLAHYGLDKPWAVVRFGEQSLRFGNTNTVTEELYLQSGEGIHAVSARSAGAVPALPAKLIAHRMFTPAELVAAVELPGFSLRHDGTRWQLTPPDAGLSQDDLVRWVEQWRYASSVLTEPGKPPERNDITIELRDGRRIGVGIKSTAPELILHRSDEALDYRFNARMASLLLASPSATASQSR